MIKQSRHVRAVLVKPRLLVGGRRAARRDDVIQLGEVVPASLTLDRKPHDAHRTHLRRARWKYVLPRQVVRRAACEDRHVMTARQTFRDGPAMRFRSADDAWAVPLDHAGQLHAEPDERFRSFAFSTASACSAANMMRLMRAWRSKLSMLYS